MPIAWGAVLLATADEEEEDWPFKRISRKEEKIEDCARERNKTYMRESRRLRRTREREREEERRRKVNLFFRFSAADCYEKTESVSRSVCNLIYIRVNIRSRYVGRCASVLWEWQSQRAPRQEGDRDGRRAGLERLEAARYTREFTQHGVEESEEERESAVEKERVREGEIEPARRITVILSGGKDEHGQRRRLTRTHQSDSTRTRGPAQGTYSLTYICVLNYMHKLLPFYFPLARRASHARCTFSAPSQPRVRRLHSHTSRVYTPRSRFFFVKKEIRALFIHSFFPHG